MDNDTIKIDALKEALSDPKINAAVSRAIIELGALCERMAEGLQKFAREVEKMAEAAEPEAAKRPAFKVGQRVRIARACEDHFIWVDTMTESVGVNGTIMRVSDDGCEVYRDSVDEEGRGYVFPPEALDPIDG